MEALVKHQSDSQQHRSASGLEPGTLEDTMAALDLARQAARSADARGIAVPLCEPVPLQSGPYAGPQAGWEPQDLLSDERAKQLLEAVFLQRGVLAAAAHDMQTPLAVVRLSLTMVEKCIADLNPKLADAVHPELALAQRAAGDMGRLVSEIGDIALLQLGAPVQLKRQRFGLAELVSEVSTGHRRIGGPQIKVTVDGPERYGFWDRGRLRRVIENLLENAMKYSRADGLVAIRVSGEIRDGTPWAVLALQDRGAEIEERDLPHVFTGLYRGPNAAAETRGSGIALLSARLIVEWHGGEIAAQSHPRWGTRFIVRLPMEAPNLHRQTLESSSVEDNFAERAA